MKKVTLLLIALFATGTLIMAQGRPQGGQRNMDPKDRATRMTERMVKEYSLTDAQKKELYEVNLEMAKNMTPPQPKADAKADVKKEKKAKKENVAKKEKEGRKQFSDDYDAKVKKILTEDQYEAYTKNKANRTKRMGERSPRPERTNN